MTLHIRHLWINWFPWRFVIKRLARQHGFIDPIQLLGAVRRFAQPAEVSESTELLRAGVVFHARGLVNTQAIQHNLDWVWPYWVTRQFDPRDKSFIPRAFSITHINLTHRNWTAIGIPDTEYMPIVDERGLVTPFWNGWSIEAIVTGDNERLIPSQEKNIVQELQMENGLVVKTLAATENLSLNSSVQMFGSENDPCCRISFTAHSLSEGQLLIGIRPYNPEGVSFVHELRFDTDASCWHVNEKHLIQLESSPDGHFRSNYRKGDVYNRLATGADAVNSTHTCDVGMITAAAAYGLSANTSRTISIIIPSRQERGQGGSESDGCWQRALESTCALEVPHSQFQFLFDAALRTIILLSPKEIYPGPYTYKRFWFRDAVFMAHAMLTVGLTSRVERALPTFLRLQKYSGHFCSQNGEWDSNGQVLWLFNRYEQIAGIPLDTPYLNAAARGAWWINHKRVDINKPVIHAGLLPAGFSAEHLGPNDYYYWDDFWSIAGLESAAHLFTARKRTEDANNCTSWAQSLRAATEKSIAAACQTNRHNAIPASPYRRMDAGAIGSIVADYPVKLWPPADPRILNTVEFLLADCFEQGMFFQDMAHSGLNAYLTLHIAQVLLRASDRRAFSLIESTAALASPTGQWPEAIHPQTHGGCMGDGQHGWAAAEWLLCMCAMFVYEEGDSLVVCAGIPEQWFYGDTELRCGPVLTIFGAVTVFVKPGAEQIIVEWESCWRKQPAHIIVRTPEGNQITISAQESSVDVPRPRGRR